MTQQLDPAVISFLKQREAPLTNANYNSVKAMFDSNPSLRGAPVAEDSATRDNPDGKHYDGGLDELNLGDDAQSHNSPAVKHGSDDAKSAHAPNSAAATQNGPAKLAANEDSGSGRNDAPDNKPASSDNGGGIDKALATALGVGGAGAGALAVGGILSALEGGGSGTSRVAPSGPSAGGTGIATIEGAPASGVSGNDILAGHAPAATLPPSTTPRLTAQPLELMPSDPQLTGPQAGGPQLTGPQSGAPQLTGPQAQTPTDPAARLAELESDRLSSDLGDRAAGSPASSFSSMAGGGPAPQGGQLAAPTGAPTEGMVAPGAAPTSKVVPMPDNVPHGTLEAILPRIRALGPQALETLVQALRAAGHIR